MDVENITGKDATVRLTYEELGKVVAAFAEQPESAGLAKAFGSLFVRVEGVRHAEEELRDHDEETARLLDKNNRDRQAQTNLAIRGYLS